MLQISQPFSFPGPTRMSRKRNLSGLSVLGRKACNKVASTPTLDSTCSTQDAASALYFVMALANLCKLRAFGRSVPTWLWAS